MHKIVVVQLALALVFLSSSVSKLPDLAGATESAAALGVPLRFARAAAWLVILAEASVTAALVIAPSVGALGAVLLVLSLSVTVGWNLVHGRRPSCHCFGRLSPRGISERTLLRNATLCFLAGLLVLEPPQPFLTWLRMQDTSSTAVVCLSSVALTALIIALDAQLPGRAKAAAPSQGDRPSADVWGMVLALQDRSHRRTPRVRRPTLLVFLSPDCSACAQTAPRAIVWSRTLVGHIDVLIVVIGDDRQARTLLGDVEGPSVLLDEEQALATACGLEAFPAGVLLHHDGRATSPQYGIAATASLLATTIHGLAPLAPSHEHLADDAVLGGWAPAPRPGLETIPQDDGSIDLADPISGAVVQLDALGVVVWQLYDGTTAISDLAHELAESFSAPVDVVKTDLMKMTRDLAHQGMLWGVPLEAAAPFDEARGDSIPAHAGT